MGTGTLERIEEVASSPLPPEAAETFRRITERLFELAPWMADLTAPEAICMVLRVIRASQDARITGDRSELHALLADWEATAEAHRDAQFRAAITDSDDEYMPWPS